MIFFYIFALLFIGAGIILWYKNHKITLNEYFIGGGIALFLAVIFNLIVLGTIHSKTGDMETWSGYVINVEHHTRWVEQWEQMHTRQVANGTDKDGNTTYRTEIYYTTEYDTHPEHWEANRYFGEITDNINISQDLYNEIKNLFGNQIVDGGKQSYNHGGSHYSGDNNIYSTPNNTGFIYPCTIIKSFKNKIKATPNLFQFSEVPTNILVHPWPTNPNWNNSDRLLGTANTFIDKLKFDQLNARLGPNKRVNLILVGVGDSPEIYGQYYQSKWIGGKKNDLVVVFGGGSPIQPAKWVFSFGWTEKDLVKRNLETIFLTNPINTSILERIEKEVNANYVIKDWRKFDYIKIYPPGWVYALYVILTLSIQAGLYTYFHANDLEKDYWNK